MAAPAGIAYNREEFELIVASGLDASPIGEVQIDQSVLGWKEYEMEVVRDRADNCIIVCSIENIDPMGVHTGDSITVAPALTDRQGISADAQRLDRGPARDRGGHRRLERPVRARPRHRADGGDRDEPARVTQLGPGVEGDRVSHRQVAAKLAVGYTLDEIKNDITGATPASFEPTIDYVVTKIPRFTFEKFPETEPLLTTAMKSVGEVMAMGRTFKESLQKALRGLETGLSGLDEIEVPGLAGDDRPQEAMLAALARPTPDRLRLIAQAFREGLGLAVIQGACAYDPWFLAQIQDIVRTEAALRRDGLPDDAASLHALKADGFSDKRLADLTGLSEDDIRTRRWALRVRPVFKRIDTCAAEFAARTPISTAAMRPAFSAIRSASARAGPATGAR